MEKKNFKIRKKEKRKQKNSTELLFSCRLLCGMKSCLFPKLKNAVKWNYIYRRTEILRYKNGETDYICSIRISSSGEILSLLPSKMYCISWLPYKSDTIFLFDSE